MKSMGDCVSRNLRACKTATNILCRAVMNANVCVCVCGWVCTVLLTWVDGYLCPGRSCDGRVRG